MRICSARLQHCAETKGKFELRAPITRYATTTKTFVFDLSQAHAQKLFLMRFATRFAFVAQKGEGGVRLHRLHDARIMV